MVNKQDVINTYRHVLNNKCNLPIDFWRISGEAKLGICIRYLIEEVMGGTKEDIKLLLNLKFLRDNRLGNAYATVCNKSMSKVLRCAYPDIHPWELNCKVYKYTEDDCVVALKWLYSEKYPYNRDFILENFNPDFLRSNKLYFINKYKDKFVYLDRAFPGEFKRWDFKVPKGYWNSETVLEYVRWYYTEYHEYDKNFILSSWISSTDFEYYKNDKYLRKIRNAVRNSNMNPIDVICNAFPDEFTEKELKGRCYRYVDPGKVKREVEQLIENNKLTEDDVYKVFSWKYLNEHGLGGLKYHYDSAFDLLELTYPGKFNKDRWLFVHLGRK